MTELASEVKYIRRAASIIISVNDNDLAHIKGERDISSPPSLRDWNPCVNVFFQATPILSKMPIINLLVAL